ncbi:MAG TPA: MFS transporter [Acidimicrobiales bacterium]|nr:MFS transporter [Acidimicrobiales bacterium]
MTDRLKLASAATFRSLHTRNFRLFFLGQLVSQAGTWMQSVAIIWVVLELTDNGLALGLVTAAQFLPLLLIGAWTGLVADRVDRYRLLVACQLAFTVLAVAFSALTLTGSQTVLSMYGLSLAFGLITAFDNPTRRVLVSEMVEPRDLPNAVGLNSAMMTGSRIFGPALAGALIAGPGAAWCFVANAVSYVAVIGALLRMDHSAFHLGPRVARAKGQVRSGLRYVWAHPTLRASVVLIAVVGLAAFNFQVTLALLAEQTFAGAAGTYTLLFSVMSAGSMLGGLAVARREAVDLPVLAKAAAGLAVSMAALALAPTLWLAVAFALPVGFTSVYLISGSNAVVQLQADPRMRGRVLALFAMLFLGSTPIGGPIVGWVSDVTNPRVAVGVGAVATALAAVWTVRYIRRAGADPIAARAAADAAAADEPLVAA